MFRRWNGVIGNRIQCMYVVPYFWNSCLKILGIYSTKRKYILCFYSVFLKIPLKGRVELRLIHNFLQIPNYIKFLRLMLLVTIFISELGFKYEIIWLENLNYPFKKWPKISLFGANIYNIQRRNLHVDFDNECAKKPPLFDLNSC